MEISKQTINQLLSSAPTKGFSTSVPQRTLIMIKFTLLLLKRIKQNFLLIKAQSTYTRCLQASYPGKQCNCASFLNCDEEER